jgi:hypothetical protein
MDIAALALAVVTLLITLFIQGETRRIFSRLNLMIHTMPGAFDMERCISDLENSKEDRATIICDSPKNTHLSFIQPAPKIGLARRAKNGFWRLLGDLAALLSGDEFKPEMVEPSRLGKWEIKCSAMGGRELSALLESGWEPFGITPDRRICVRKHRRMDEK